MFSYLCRAGSASDFIVERPQVNDVEHHMHIEVLFIGIQLSGCSMLSFLN